MNNFYVIKFLRVVIDLKMGFEIFILDLNLDIC